MCTFCKRRKVRCDKGAPCSTCVKYGNKNCEYVNDVYQTKAAPHSNGFNESVLSLETVPMTRKPASMVSLIPNSAHRPGSNSSSSRSHSTGSLTSRYVNGSAPLLTPAVHSELELLKQKILMLEQLVSYSNHIDGTSSSTSASSPSEPVKWQGRLNGEENSLLGYYPSSSADETLSFHDNYLPFLSMQNMGSRYCAPLSWIALIKVDNAVSSMFAYKRKNVLLKRYLTKELSKDIETLKPAERFFREKISNEVALNDDSLFPDSSNLYPNKKNKNVPQQFVEKAKSLGLTVYEGDLDSVHDVLDKIQLILPTAKIVWMLVDRFFARVYPFFPFIDQFDFEHHLERIFGSNSRAHEKIKKLHVQGRMDLAFLALLLMVLRFGYLTLITNSDAMNEANLHSTDPSQRAQEIKFLMMNPIHMDFVDVAQVCLLQFGYLRVSNLSLLQLSLYIKLYFSFAPENGDSPEDTNSQSYTSMLINMAMSLGLHREPDNFKGKIRDDRTSNLCRKIWYYLLIIDLHNGMSNGSAPCVSGEMFDTSPPYYKPGNENVRDIEIEKEAVNGFRIDRCYNLLNSVVRSISSVHSPINLRDLYLKLSELEIEYIGEQRALVMEPNSQRLVPIDVSQAIQTKIYFQANFFLAGIAFHLFNHYERKNEIDLAYFYLKKVVSIVIFNTMPFYEDYVDKSYIWFQNSTDLAVTPSFQALVHKCMIVIQSTMARARFSLLQCESLPTHSEDMATNPEYKKRYDLLIEIFSLCDKCLSCFVSTLTKLSSRFYYSWRCLKAYEGLKGAREGTDYYLNFCKGREGYMLFTTPMLEDFVSVLKESLKVVRNNQLLKGVTPMFPEEMFSMDNEINSMPPIPETPVPILGENIDAWWMQMMTMKPQMTKSILFSHTPPTVELDIGSGTFDSNLDNLVFGNDYSIFDSIFEDPI